MEEAVVNEWRDRMERLKRETREGGELKDLPCPFCGKPRSQRSDYVRCQSCGVNWLQDEMGLPNYLNRNPSAARSEAARMTQANAVTKFTAAPSKAGASV